MPTDTSPAPVSKLLRWTSYLLSAVPVLMLVMSGVMKLAQPASVVDGFIKMGYPAGQIFPLGIVELASTVIYLIPRTSVLGAILLTGYLGGATATLVRVEDPTFVAPVLLGIMLWGGLFLRDPRLRVLIPLRHNLS